MGDVVVVGRTGFVEGNTCLFVFFVDGGGAVGRKYGGLTMVVVMMEVVLVMVW